MAYAQMATITTGEVVTAAYLNVIKANWDATINATSGYVQDSILAASAADKRVIERNSSVGNGNLQWIVPFGRLLATDGSETTSTSGSYTTLASVSGLSVPATSALFIMVSWRKAHTSGSSAATWRFTVDAGGVATGGYSTAANTSDELAAIVAYIGPRSTSYKRAFVAMGAETAAAGEIIPAPSAADFPDTIAGINAQGLVASGSATIGMQDLIVYEIPAGA